nr:MAG TPA: hypothetical protein [Bacteriophage sp.]
MELLYHILDTLVFPLNHDITNNKLLYNHM